MLIKYACTFAGAVSRRCEKDETIRTPTTTLIMNEKPPKRMTRHGKPCATMGTLGKSWMVKGPPSGSATLRNHPKTHLNILNTTQANKFQPLCHQVGVCPRLVFGSRLWSMVFGHKDMIRLISSIIQVIDGMILGH